MQQQSEVGYSSSNSSENPERLLGNEVVWVSKEAAVKVHDSVVVVVSFEVLVCCGALEEIVFVVFGELYSAEVFVEIMSGQEVYERRDQLQLEMSIRPPSFLRQKFAGKVEPLVFRMNVPCKFVDKLVEFVGILGN